MTSRSIVAISEDRQWLVVRVPQVGMLRAFGYEIHKRVRFVEHYGYMYHDSVLGTGQSADEVLREFLEGKDA